MRLNASQEPSRLDTVQDDIKRAAVVDGAQKRELVGRHESQLSSPRDDGNTGYRRIGSMGRPIVTSMVWLGANKTPECAASSQERIGFMA